MCVLFDLFVSILRTVLNVFCWIVYHVGASHNVLYVLCWLVFLCLGVAHCFLCVLLTFFTLVSRALFGMSFLDSLWRQFLGHLCVLLTVRHVSASLSVLYVFGLIVSFVRVWRTVLAVFFMIFCHVSVLCTVLNVFCWSVHHVSASHNVLYVFCWRFVTFGYRTLVFMCSVDFLPRKCLAHCFVWVFLTIYHVSALCTVLYVFCSIVWFVSALRTVLTMFFKVFC